MEVYFRNKYASVESTGLLESDFIEKTIQAFQEAINVAGYKFWIINGYEDEPYQYDLLDKKTIVLIFDEHRKTDVQLTASAAAVFQAYIGDAERIAPNHYCMPLGYTKGFIRSALKPINARKTSVLFIGNLHKGRKDFYRWLSGYPLPFFLLSRIQKKLDTKFDKRFTNAYIRFTSGFNKGLNNAEYSSLIADSRITLCPGGILAVESFRFYEAMMQGSVIISERLPKRSLFNGCPVIEIGNWSSATEIIRQLLTDEQKMQSISDLTVKWYEATVSPEAVGKYIAQKISAVG